MFTKLKITAVIVNANPQVAGVAVIYLQALKTDKYSGNSYSCFSFLPLLHH